MNSSQRYPFELKTYELDHRRRMPVAILYRLLQEAAENHAVEMGFDTETLLHRNLTWVLLRLQLEISEYPEGRQPIDVETWPSKSDSRYAFREFRVFKRGGIQPFAVASSIWMLIDLVKNRPVIIDKYLSREYITRREQMVATPFPKIGECGDAVGHEFTVRLSDIDLNNHVNNVHFVEWVVESTSEHEWTERTLASIAMEYKKQVRYGDTVHISTSRVDGDTYDYVMTSRLQQGDILRARTVWR